MVASATTWCFQVGDDLLTAEQLAEKLQLKTTWVYEQTRQRASTRNPDPLPSIRVGKYLRFCWPDVVEWLNRCNGGNKK